jgi:uncharacterized protein (DUF433 family)
VHGTSRYLAGTRITVELILEKLAAGETYEQILEAHLRLSRNGIQAALAFAAEVLRADVQSAFTRTGTWFCGNCSWCDPYSPV